MKHLIALNEFIFHCSGAHPTSYPMCNLGAKAVGAWSWPITSI